MRAVKVFGTALISQILTFLNAAFQPFEGTIFVFEDWQPIASRSAVACGFVVVLVIAAVMLNRSVTAMSIISCGIVSGILLAACAGIHFLLASGFAPTTAFLFWARDIVWMVVYIVMLIMVGVTVALACLRMFNQAAPAN
jgi:hypothetical protein